MRNQGQRIGDAMNRMIYRRYKKDGLTMREVARLFGVSDSHVGKVIREMENKELGSGICRDDAVTINNKEAA
jgi:transposase-like protein